MPIKAVIFDLGGVVLDSPMEIFAAFEKSHGLPENFLNKFIVESGHEGAWAAWSAANSLWNNSLAPLMKKSEMPAQMSPAGNSWLR